LISQKAKEFLIKEKVDIDSELDRFIDLLY